MDLFGDMYSGTVDMLNSGVDAEEFEEEQQEQQSDTIPVSRTQWEEMQRTAREQSKMISDMGAQLGTLRNVSESLANTSQNLAETRRQEYQQPSNNDVFGGIFGEPARKPEVQQPTITMEEMQRIAEEKANKAVYTANQQQIAFQTKATEIATRFQTEHPELASSPVHNQYAVNRFQMYARMHGATSPEHLDAVYSKTMEDIATEIQAGILTRPASQPQQRRIQPPRYANANQQMAPSPVSQRGALSMTTLESEEAARAEALKLRQDRFNKIRGAHA